MRQRAARWAGQGAVLALLLQLALPLLTLHQATAAPGPGGAFVICTGAGLVWIMPDGAPASGDDGENDAGHHCPVCFSKHLLATALSPTAGPLPPPRRHFAGTALPAEHATPAPKSAPPLPARGPPLAA